jgi:hypothetical protein
MSYTIAKPINIELFNKKYQFRELNTNAASNLQLFPQILKLIDKKFGKDDSLTKTYVDCLKNDTPEIERINTKDTSKILNNSHLTYPVLFITIGLQEKITELYKQLEK